MSRELMLLRHGKAEGYDANGDFHRELKNKGKRHAQRIAIWLASNSMVPDHVISSSAERAVATARKCCKAMGVPAHKIEITDELYLAPLHKLLEIIHACPDDVQRLMLVGHNPGLEHLLQRLCHTPPAKPADHNLMPTATLARLSVPGDWNALQFGQCELLALQRGEDLPESFPFPDENGSERRSRPAYYYTQSSVVPYRVHDGEPQVMIVRSSSDRHWVVPKGIADPGMTPQDSARKEALEEAGVEGRIVGEPLGNYDYPKWGASCSVEVYAMQVEHELPEEEWEENHRGRRWVSADMAAALVKQRALEPMIKALAERLLESA